MFNNYPTNVTANDIDALCPIDSPNEVVRFCITVEVEQPRNEDNAVLMGEAVAYLEEAILNPNAYRDCIDISEVD